MILYAKIVEGKNERKDDKVKKEYSELELEELEFIEEKDLEEVVGGLKLGSLYIETD